jgi:Na+/H+-dicarboxylate symporter
MGSKFTRYILGAMVLGIVMGALIYQYAPDNRNDLANSINLIAMLFLRLIKMIIAPLVFATLVGGIAHMGSGSRLGRIFAKTMGWGPGSAASSQKPWAGSSPPRSSR